jgi:hypothetical protein
MLTVYLFDCIDRTVKVKPYYTDLLEICWRLAVDLLATQRICLQQIYSKSPACCRHAGNEQLFFL